VFEAVAEKLSVELKPRLGVARGNTHPFAYVQRFLATRQIALHLPHAFSVYVVGVSTEALARNSRLAAIFAPLTCHFLTDRPIPPNPNHTSCSCVPYQCRHVARCDIVMLVEFYDFTREIFDHWLQASRQSTVYVANYLYETPFGSLANGDFEYYAVDANRVEVIPRGGGLTYIHSAHLELSNSPYRVQGTNLAANIHEVCRVSSLPIRSYTLDAKAVIAEVVLPSFVTATQSDSVVGILKESEKMSSAARQFYTTLRLRDSDVFSWQGYLVHFRMGKPVLVPKNVLNRALIYMQGKARTTQNETALKTNVAALMQETGMPFGFQAQAVAAITQYAFLCDVEVEKEWALKFTGPKGVYSLAGASTVQVLNSYKRDATRDMEPLEYDSWYKYVRFLVTRFVTEARGWAILLRDLILISLAGLLLISFIVAIARGPRTPAPFSFWSSLNQTYWELPSYNYSNFDSFVNFTQVRESISGSTLLNQTKNLASDYYQTFLNVSQFPRNVSFTLPHFNGTTALNFLNSGETALRGFLDTIVNATNNTTGSLYDQWDNAVDIINLWWYRNEARSLPPPNQISLFDAWYESFVVTVWVVTDTLIVVYRFAASTLLFLYSTFMSLGYLASNFLALLLTIWMGLMRFAYAFQGVLAETLRVFNSFLQAITGRPYSAFGDLIISPFFEEILKHYFSWLSLPIAFVEAWVEGQFLINFVWRLAVHYSLSRHPLALAIFMHFALNMSIYAGAYRLTTSIMAAILMAGVYTELPNWSPASFSLERFEPSHLRSYSIARIVLPTIVLDVDHKKLNVDPLAEFINPMEYVEKEYPKVHWLGLGFPGALPHAHRSCTTNDILAIYKRVLSPVATVQEPYDSMFLGACHRLLEETKLVGSYRPVLWDLWNQRFPAAQQRRHREALETVQVFGLRNKDFVVKAFIKKELLMDNCLGPNGKVCRLIQGLSDKVNVALGPPVLGISKALLRSWNPTARIFYAAGPPAEVIGEWYLSVLLNQSPIYSEDYEDNDIFEDPDSAYLFGRRRVFTTDRYYAALHYPSWVVEGDFSDYDSSFGELACTIERKAFALMGITASELLPLVHPLPIMRRFNNAKGFTPSGVGYKTRFRRRSGEPQTSCGNSIMTALVYMMVLWKNGYALNDVRMVVLGDDMLMVAYKEDITKIDFRSELAAIGFKAKIKLPPKTHAQFCSGRFYPALDGVVLGPKIFRWLPKIGFTLVQVLHDEEKIHLRGVALGFWKDVAHIPILSHYAQRVLSLTSDISAPIAVPDYYQHAREPHHPSEAIHWFLGAIYGHHAENFGKLIELIDGIKSFPHAIEWPGVSDLLIIDNE